MENDMIPGSPAGTSKRELTDKQRLLLAQRMRGAGRTAIVDKIEPRPPGSPTPLSAEQRRVWLHASQQSDSAIYNEPITIQKLGSFNLEVLSASLDEIVRRHEAWRTSFDANGIGVVHPPLHVPLPFTDVSGLPSSSREEEAIRIATADAQQPLSLAKAPLFRARVVRVDDGDHRLYLTLHHIIFDGVSLAAILLPELAAIYEAFEQGLPSPLSEPTIQYADYAVWRERQLAAPTLKKHLDYWLKQLGGELPVLRLPTDRVRPAMPSHRGSMERFTVPPELTNALRTLCRARGVTLYMVLLAAYKVLLFRYSGQEDVIVGSAIDGRRHPDLKQVIGYFLDTVSIRTKPTDTTLFSDYLKEVRDTVLDAFAAADVPFDRVVHELRPKRDSSHHPIFQAFFSMRPLMGALPDGWKLNHVDVAAGAVKFDIYLEFGEQANDIEGRILYSADLFDASSVRRMEEHYLVLLQSICEAPDAPLRYINLLGEEERAALLGASGWNATEQDTPRVTLQTLIQDQVQRTPSAIAVVSGGQQFSYRDVDLRSLEIARSLVSAGVTAGSLVAVALERSADLVAGLLAVLRLGAAYLPLDILMSPERFSQCLTDAQPKAVLTQTKFLAQLNDVEVAKVLLEGVSKIAEVSSAPSSLPPELFESGSPNDTAYVIYTSGTSGEPKAVEISQFSLINLLTTMQREPGFQSHDRMLAVTPISFDIAALELFVPLISGGSINLASREEVQDPTYLRTRSDNHDAP